MVGARLGDDPTPEEDPGFVVTWSEEDPMEIFQTAFARVPANAPRPEPWWRRFFRWLGR